MTFLGTWDFHAEAEQGHASIIHKAFKGLVMLSGVTLHALMNLILIIISKWELKGVVEAHGARKKIGAIFSPMAILEGSLRRVAK